MRLKAAAGGLGAVALWGSLMCAPMVAAPSSSQVMPARWNEIGRKLMAMAEDFPEEKYEFRPTPAQRSFAEQLLHVSASMYYFRDGAQGQKPRHPDDPKRDGLKSKPEVVAFVKKYVENGAELIKSKGDKGMGEWITKSREQAADSGVGLGV